MGSNWIKRSEKVQEQTDALQEAEEKDRLDHARSIRFTLNAMHRSLTVWFQRVRNPEIMARSTRDYLEGTDQNLAESARSFMEYDLKMTGKGEHKGLKAKRRDRRRRGAEEIRTS